MYIDTHAHLNFKAFEEDWPQVVEEAKKNGVRKIVVPGADLDSSQKAIKIAEKTDGVYAAVGFHPHHCKGISNFDDMTDRLEKLAKSKKVVAIGECGLDYHVYQKTKHENKKITEGQKRLQKRVFGSQIQLAKKLQLPMIIHNREAQKEILDVLDHFCKSDGKYPKGVFHCISGSVKFVKELLKMGFYVGVDGNVTYSSEVQALLKEIPLDRLLLETDAPFLLPEPLRSSSTLKGPASQLKLQERTLIDRLRNEPVNVKIVAEFISGAKNTLINQIEELTTKNAERLFKI